MINAKDSQDPSGRAEGFWCGLLLPRRQERANRNKQYKGILGQTNKIRTRT